MKQSVKALLREVPIIKQILKIRYNSQQAKSLGIFPAGHYYSPIPAREEVLNYIQSRKEPEKQVPGINLNENYQYELLTEYSQFYKDLPFPVHQNSDYRYYFDNIWFGSTDAIFLHSFLRKEQPKRIIEVGSGFSSAVILDTIDRFYVQKPDVTFIEPYPDRLNSLLRDSDQERVKLIEGKVQDVSPNVFSTLEAGDLLFIDSSHVVKCNSDVFFLLFEILPLLKPNVFVHFHDVFYPFDYPSDWLKIGRYWNENYFLRAFLSYNSKWSIQFFNSYAQFRFGDFLKEKMPLCTQDPGSSLYIKRNQ
jgi:predicted O-methyltransferase YrrM